MNKILLSILSVILFAQPALCNEKEVPWWKQQKIRFMWGTWGLSKSDPEKWHEVFHNVALSGATVYAECWSGYDPDNARLARKYGLKYFAGTRSRHPLWYETGRAWIKENGEKEMVDIKFPFKCPLDERVYERWLVQPFLEGIQDGFIDGISLDWEAGGLPLTACYCDYCFSHSPDFMKTGQALPAPAERFGWLKSRGLVDAYKESHAKQQIAMLTRIRRKLQESNPNLLFASYPMEVTNFSRAMNTPEAPFIFLDARHYTNDDRKPWWESYGERLRQDGYLYIPGSWTNTLFGSMPSQVSAERWLYEGAINEDGHWMWFEHEPTDDMLRAYSAADRAIKAVEAKLGPFLFNGKRDLNFVTTAEWTGRPELEQAIVQQTYHLDNQHLVHINNVDSDWPLRVRIRFPRVAQGKQWTVRDAMGEKYYTRDGKSARWTSANLLTGVVVAMETRSDMFLLVSPADDQPEVDSSHLMYSREFNVLPKHAVASAQAAPVKRQPVCLPRAGWHFKMDEKDVALEAKWFLPTAPLDGWDPIEIENYWGAKGGTGPGWYRGDVNIPPLPKDKQIYLHFGAVDEELMLWIDGQFAGEHNLGPDGWDKPFTLDVTGKLTAGKHHLAMRVVNSAGAGGIWKPVSIMTGSAVEGATELINLQSAQDTARIVYTATEGMVPMESRGGGALIISNAIHTVNSDGTNDRRVRQLHGHLWSPRYSPNGKFIAFVHNTRGRGQIFVMNADGSGAVNISNNDFCDRSPAWSSDSERIAFVSDRSGDWDICVMNAAGSNPRRIVDNLGLDRAPTWSPDGRRILWESRTSGTPNAWVCDANGENSRPVILPGTHLVHRMAREWERTPTIEDVEPVFPDNTPYLWDPVWSPDGKSIAASALNSIAGETPVVLAADGSSLLQLLYAFTGIDHVSWSPDGKWLAGTLRCAPQESERSGIFVMKADGTDKRARGFWIVDVSPQGPRLGGTGRAGLMTWYSHGSAQPRRVLKTFTSLTWSPDGKMLAFSSDMAPSGAFYVYLISPEGGKPKRLDVTKSAWPNEIMWQPK